MPEKISAQTETGIVKIPEMAMEWVIGDEWINRRDQLIADSAGIIVSDQTGMYAAGDLLNAVTKHDKALEKDRMDFARPFSQVAKLIKQAADNATNPLRAVKDELNKKISAFAAIQRRIEREEREAAEQKAREEAAEKADLAMAADDLGLGGEEAQEIVVETEQVKRRAVAGSVRVVQTPVMQSADLDKLPRAFLEVSSKAINAYIRENKESLKTQLEELPEDATIEPVPGLVLVLKTSTASN